MSQISRLRDLLAHVTYKPGWKISVTEGSRGYGWPPYHDQIIVAVQYMVKDPEDTSRAIVRYFRRCFYEEQIECMGDYNLVDYVIRRVLVEAEMFELDACLKIDGQRVRQPDRR